MASYNDVHTVSKLKDGDYVYFYTGDDTQVRHATARVVGDVVTLLDLRVKEIDMLMEGFPDGLLGLDGEDEVEESGDSSSDSSSASQGEGSGDSSSEESYAVPPKTFVGWVGARNASGEVGVTDTVRPSLDDIRRSKIQRSTYAALTKKDYYFRSDLRKVLRTRRNSINLSLATLPIYQETMQHHCRWQWQ